MTETIKWWQSKTILANILGVIAGVGAMAGLNLDASLQSQLVELVIATGTVISGAVGIYGRFTATKKIG